MAIDDLQLSRLDFIKIDVEGMELEVLAGARNSLERHRPAVMVEVLKSGEEPVVSFLTPLGYRTWKWGINLIAVHLNDPLSDKIQLS